MTWQIMPSHMVILCTFSEQLKHSCKHSNTPQTINLAKSTIVNEICIPKTETTIHSLITETPRETLYHYYMLTMKCRYASLLYAYIGKTFNGII